MLMNTISELNNHWWYKLVKVLYLLALIFMFSVSLKFQLPDELLIDTLRSGIECEDGSIGNRSDQKFYREAMQMSDEELRQECLGNDAKLVIRYDFQSYIPEFLKSLFGTLLLALILNFIFYYIVFGTFYPRRV